MAGVEGRVALVTTRSTIHAGHASLHFTLTDPMFQHTPDRIRFSATVEGDIGQCRLVPLNQITLYLRKNHVPCSCTRC